MTTIPGTQVFFAWDDKMTQQVKAFAGQAW